LVICHRFYFTKISHTTVKSRQYTNSKTVLRWIK